MYYYHLIEYVRMRKSFSKVTKRYIKVIYKKLETRKMLGKRRSNNNSMVQKQNRK